MNNQTQQPDQKKPSFLVEYWYVVLFIVAFMLIVIAQALRILTPGQPPSDLESWNGLVPGYTTLSQVNEQLGSPIDSKQIEFGTELQYQSVYPATPNKVIVDDSSQVKFMRETVKYDKQNTLSQYVQENGPSDLEMWAPAAGYGLRAHIYLSKGVAIIAYVNSDIISEKWYFPPVSEAVFLQTWGRDLTNEERGPEAFDTAN